MNVISLENGISDPFNQFSLTKSKLYSQFIFSSPIKSNLLVTFDVEPTLIGWARVDSIWSSLNCLNPDVWFNELTTSSHSWIGTLDLIEYEKFW